MEHNNSLENQLRGMMLSNVTIAHDQTNQASPSQPQRGRGRGRGRGGFSRGYNRRHETHAGHNPDQNFNGPGAAPPVTRGGRANFNNYPDARYRQPQVTSHNQPESGTQQNGPTAYVSGQHAPRPQRQARSYNPASPPDSLTPNGGRPPKIFQRSFGDANMQGQGQTDAAAPHYPRSQPSYPYRPHMNQPRENPVVQIEHLEHLAAQEIPKVEMTVDEREEKETFRKHLEEILQQAFAEGYSGEISAISLVSFGSLASGFGMPGSDMDLAVVPAWKDPSRGDQVGIDRDIPRLLEQAVLDAKMGGRLLTRTRVPILKVCQNPMEKLYTALLEERKKWDELSEEEQYPTQLPLQEPSPSPHPSQHSQPVAEVGTQKPVELQQHANSSGFGANASNASIETTPKGGQSKVNPQDSATKLDVINGNGTNSVANKDQHQRPEKPWAREKILGPLDFPKTGVGIQCDINFENPLGIHNTQLLRCYSLCDPRVRSIVLFVKSWAKTRKINSSYSGTLSSYGWVLMVLHYLVNVAQPPVCPNLQHLGLDKDTQVGNYTVHFWRDEQAITQAAQSGQLTQNRQSVGALLRGFFQYFASVPSYGYGPRPPQFYWTTEVMSLRTPGGILTKQSKGWVSAKTIQTAEKKVTNRYLFAIEDPFEVDHNVARTVTHRGIVAIRDEFRRAWRIMSAIGRDLQPEGGIFDEVVEDLPPTTVEAMPVGGESKSEKTGQQ